VPNCPDRVQQLAYSHELSSCGYWPGGSTEGSFYASAYPTPGSFADWPVEPRAYFGGALGEFILPYPCRRSRNSRGGRSRNSRPGPGCHGAVDHLLSSTVRIGGVPVRRATRCPVEIALGVGSDASASLPECAPAAAGDGVKPRRARSGARWARRAQRADGTAVAHRGGASQRGLDTVGGSGTVQPSSLCPGRRLGR
jgi:hypothetical protein